MKKSSWVAGLVLTAAVGFQSSAATPPPAPDCPDGTTASGGMCVLDGDLELAAPLELPAGTTLNCAGYRLTPTSPGSGTSQATYVASVPPIAVVITGASDADVRNCVIGDEDERFDFGVIAVASKNARKRGHRIHENEIHARDAAVVLLDVDDARVAHNVLTWTNGYGVWVGRDSDRNRIHDNVMSSPGAPAMPNRVLPDGPFRTSDDAVFLAVLHPTPVLNLVVGDQLYQFPNSVDGTYSSQDDNVVEGNDISLPGSSVGKSHAGILVAINAMRTRIVGNTVSEAGVGIRFAGLMPTQPVQRASRCVDANDVVTNRFCASNADCFIAGYDDAPVGTCPALSTDTRDLRANGTRVEDNTLIGPFNSTDPAIRAGIFAGNGTVAPMVRRNHVVGTGTENGITLAGASFDSGTFTENVVEGAAFGLLLAPLSDSVFGARVFLNDITGSTTRAIGLQGTYSLAIELSANGVGNYWGHDAPPCFASTDTPLPLLIQDSHAFCAPVALTGP